MKLKKESQAYLNRLKKYGYNTPHPNSILGIALQEGDNPTIQLILDGARRDDEDARYLTSWGKRGFLEIDR
jgi:hypothetical protein